LQRCASRYPPERKATGACGSEGVKMADLKGLLRLLGLSAAALLAIGFTIVMGSVPLELVAIR